VPFQKSKMVHNVTRNDPQVNVIKLRKTCHSEEPTGDEESPKITLTFLFGGSFVTAFLRTTPLTKGH